MYHHIQSTIDPMSLRDLHGPSEHRHRECGGGGCLTVHFESEENRRAFQEMAVEPSSLDFSYEGDEWVDEG